MVAASKPGFKARLKEKIMATGTSLCIGADPHVAKLPPFFEKELRTRGPAHFLTEFSCALIDAGSGVAPAIKFQSAFYEAFGAEGFAVLQKMLKRAKEKGLITLLDAKRGDISSTMAAYGTMAFDVMDADALTVTPYMGFDVIEPLIPWLERGRGVYLVWVSSNPGGSLLQDKVLASGQTASAALFDAFISEFQKRGLDDAFGLVLGATRVDTLSPELLSRARHASLLMPGVGAQGGVVTPTIMDIIHKTATVLVPQSRSLASFGAETTSWRDYCALVEARVRTAAAELAFAP